MCIADIIDELTESVQPHDRVRLTITLQTLHHEIWLPFMTPEQLMADCVMVEVDRVVQSKDTWLFSDFYLNFIHAPLPFSSRWNRGAAGCLASYLAPQQGCLVLREGHRDGKGHGAQPSQVAQHQAGKV